MFTVLIAIFFCAAYPPTPKAPKLENGFYEILDEKAKNGISFPRSDGDGFRILGNRRGDQFGKAKVLSNSKDNSSFEINLPDALPTGLADEKRNLLGGVPPELAIVIDGICIRALVIHSKTREDTEPSRYVGIRARIEGLANAKKIAAHFKVEAELRKHPGHQLVVKWVPEKETFAVGEAVKLKLHITNVGTKPVCLEIYEAKDGKDNDPTAFIFRFLAETRKGNGSPIPAIDTSHRLSPGGPTYHTLNPEGVHTTSISLEEWYKFTEPDTYRITGICEVQICDPNDGGDRKKRIWDELLVAECVVKVKK